MRVTRAVLIMLVGAAVLAAPAVSAQARNRACAGPEFRTDRVGPVVEHRHAVRVVRCIFRRVVGGSTDTAVAVSGCESGHDDEAVNGSSGAAGLFQHLRRYWPGRARALPDRQFHGRTPGVFNARANAWAAARMVNASGWGAWDGACA